MTVFDPSTAPRNPAAGYKGDGWIVPLADADLTAQVLALDTGLDSVVIVRIPTGRWDRGDDPTEVHAHQDHDEAIVLGTGSGTLIHGTDLGHLRATRFSGPVTMVLPAGTWHHVVMDADVDATGTCFFTQPGTVVVPFDQRPSLNSYGQVTYADLPIVSPRRPEPGSWSGRLDAADRVGALDPTPPGPTAPTSSDRDARVLTAPVRSDGLVLPLDTGRDSLFVMLGHGRSWDRNPTIVDVHSHPDVDEFIVIEGGVGYLLNGPDLASVTRTPFEGPAVIVMPAGGFHRIVRTDDDVVDSVLVYADRHAVVPRYREILARTPAALLPLSEPKGAAS